MSDGAWIAAAEKDLRGSFSIKDSGKREEYDSGMRRDTTDGKADYSLVYDGPLVDRYAMHMTKGAEKYGRRNWQLANSEAELERFKASAARHFRQWLRGDQDEDHFAAVVFNCNAAEYVKYILAGPEAPLKDDVAPWDVKHEYTKVGNQWVAKYALASGQVPPGVEAADFIAAAEKQQAENAAPVRMMYDPIIGGCSADDGDTCPCERC